GAGHAPQPGAIGSGGAARRRDGGAAGHGSAMAGRRAAPLEQPATARIVVDLQRRQRPAAGARQPRPNALRPRPRGAGRASAAGRLDLGGALAYSERGNVYRLQGKLDDALADCGRAVRLDPKLVTAYCHRAEVWVARGEPAKAVADCDAALKRDGDCALAYCV